MTVRPVGTETPKAPQLVVLADDRTGAHETAGACADHGCGSVPVVSWSALGSAIASNHRIVVVDLESRHLDPDAAAARVSAVRDECDRLWGDGFRVAHKIDSTLRGNWAHELIASRRLGNLPVVIVPAFPEAGRTCANGVVLDHGIPVADGPAGRDPRRPVTSSEPAVHLAAAGAEGSIAIRVSSELRSWLSDPAPGFAVCDAVTERDLADFAAAWSTQSNAVFAGTAASIAAAASAVIEPRRPDVSTSLPLQTPALIVCGSVHPAARRQLRVLTEATEGTALAGVIDVIAPPGPESAVVDSSDADRHARSLARSARSAMSARTYATVIVLGGDTASAFLGAGPLLVHGTLAPGTAWGVHLGTLLVTRPGGFGGDSALIDLIIAHDGDVPSTSPQP